MARGALLSVLFAAAMAGSCVEAAEAGHTPTHPLQSAPEPAPITLVAKEALLAELVAGAVPESLVFCSHYKRYAYVVRRKAGDFVVTDGVEGQPYDQVSDITFSPDGKRVTYKARRGRRWVVVIDGVMTAEYDWAGKVHFAPEGKHFAFAAEWCQGRFIVVDGVEGKVFGAVSAPVFSPDGAHVAYAAGYDPCVDGGFGKWVVVEDEVAGTPYRWATRPRYSEDSQRLLYDAGDFWDLQVSNGQKARSPSGDHSWEIDASTDGLHVAHVCCKSYDPVGGLREFVDWLPGGDLIFPGTKSKSHVVYDGKESVVYKDAHIDQVTLSGDGTRLTYVVRQRDRSFLILDGAEGKRYDWVDTVTFSPDGRRVGYLAGVKHGCTLVLDGAEWNRCDGMSYGPIIFSPDSNHAAYVVERHGGFVYVVDGVEGRLYKDVGPIFFSPDCSRTAYLAKRGENIVVVCDGEELVEYDAAAPGGFVFSPVGNRLAYVARRRYNMFVVVDGKEGRCYRGVRQPSFSPDGAHLVYEAKRQDGWHVVVDAIEGKAHDEVHRPFFSADGRHMAYAAREGDESVIVVDGVESPRYGRFFGEVHFEGPDTIRAIGERGGRILLVDMEIVEKDSGAAVKIAGRDAS